jgi:hypothetical protein
MSPEEISGVLASQEALDESRLRLRTEGGRQPQTDRDTSSTDSSVSPVQRMFTQPLASCAPQGTADAVLVNSAPEPPSPVTSTTLFADHRSGHDAAGARVRGPRRASPVRVVSSGRRRSPDSSARGRRATRPGAVDVAAERSDAAKEEFLTARLARARSKSLSPRQHRAAAAAEENADGVRSASKRADPGGRQAAERSALRALRMEREQQQQVVVAGLAARGAGITTSSFEKLRNKFFRACADEAALCGREARVQRSRGVAGAEEGGWLAAMEAAESVRCAMRDAIYSHWYFSQ